MKLRIAKKIYDQYGYRMSTYRRARRRLSRWLGYPSCHFLGVWMQLKLDTNESFLETLR